MKIVNHRQIAPPIILIAIGILMIVSVPVVLQMQNRPSSISISGKSKASGIGYISPVVANTALFQKQAVFIDIRNEEHFIINHIAGAINIPFTELKSQLPELKENRWIILYSQESTDFEISAANKLLFDGGISQVNVLKGGLNAWNELVYPVVLLP